MKQNKTHTSSGEVYSPVTGDKPTDSYRSCTWLIEEELWWRHLGVAIGALKRTSNVNLGIRNRCLPFTLISTVNYQGWAFMVKITSIKDITQHLLCARYCAMCFTCNSFNPCYNSMRWTFLFSLSYKGGNWTVKKSNLLMITKLVRGGVTI